VPFPGVQKKPSFFGEYDTRRFFVCWWYSGNSSLICAHADHEQLVGAVGP
jgi:hypothetical protein